MKQEFEMTQEEMDNIISINKGGGDPVMFLSGGAPMGYSLQEKINQYWEILGKKYGFKPMTVEASSKGKLYFLAEPIPVEKPKTQTEIEIEKYVGDSYGHVNVYVKDALRRIVAQLECCNYENEAGILNNNIAFISLKQMAE